VAHQGIDMVREIVAAAGFGETLPLEERRARMEASAGSIPAPDGVTVEPDIVGGRPAEWMRPDGVERGRVVLYLHGGGYCVGSIASHRNFAGRLALVAGLSVCNLEYRLAPEHPFPAAIDDAVAAFDDIVARGHDPGTVAIGGDSAGGGLTAATLLALRDRGGPQPAAGVCISPWADLTQTSATYESRADVDPMCNKAGLDLMAAAYRSGADATDPLVSPVYADLGGLPPLLIDVGDAEVLLDDAVALAERAVAAGVDVRLTVWPEMVHVFQAFPPEILPESDQSLAAIAAFLDERLA
jgi:acetyl esterase/lipase